MSLFFFGTTLTKDELEKITGYTLHPYLKVRADIIKEILIRRATAPTTQIRKLKFFSLPMCDYEKFANKYSQIILSLKEGINAEGYVAFTVKSQKEVFDKINAKYSYGDMNVETRQKYIADLDKEFGDRLVTLYEPQVK